MSTADTALKEAGYQARAAGERARQSRQKGNTLDVVVGGQYGSESKGRVTANLAERRRAEGRAVIGVRVAGPNAGHVVIDDNGERYALRQVPVALVSDPMALGVIAAGSEIELPVLEQEIEDLERGGHAIRRRLLIDNQATMLLERNKLAEGGNDGPLQNRIGSTGKGIGSARSDRIWRTAPIAKDERRLNDLGHVIPRTGLFLTRQLNEARSRSAVVIEGTQGYGLGLHAGHYPYCTTSDCRAIDFLAMAGVSPWGLVEAELNVWVVLRAYPIRVAGNSGPMRNETSWEELGLPVEYTTVTKKERRVGHWDAQLAKDAVEANGGAVVKIALAMADQRYPGLAGIEHWADVPVWYEGDHSPEGQFRAEVAAWIDEIERDTGAKVASIGTGPRSTLWLDGTDAGRKPEREREPWHHDHGAHDERAERAAYYADDDPEHAAQWGKL